MNLLKRLPPVVIPPGNPYENDRLGFEETGLRVRRLIWQIEGPFVLSINADWGVGKTTFIRMLQALLRNEEVECVYLDAWANDFAEPLAALISEVNTKIDHGADAKEKLLEAGRTALGFLSAKGAAKVATIFAKAVVRKLGGQETLDEVNDLIEGGGESIEHQIDDALKEYDAQRQSLEAFREALKAFADEVRGSATSASTPPLVFFVDELDRCRPSYAIEFLEMAKHLFSVEGVVFVLAVNVAQLANAIRGLYGEKFDAERYLRRFVDVQLDLPVPDIGKYASLVLESLLGNELELANPSADQIYVGQELNRRARYWEAVSVLLVEMAKRKRWPPRDIEQLAFKFAVALRLVESPEQLDPVLLTCCVVALYLDSAMAIDALRDTDAAKLRAILQNQKLLVSPNEREDPVWGVAYIALDYFSAEKREKWRSSKLEELKRQIREAGTPLHYRMHQYLHDVEQLASFRETANAALLTAQVITDPSRQLDPTGGAVRN